MTRRNPWRGGGLGLELGAPVYFASGSSRPADIAGLARAGHAIGVCAPELSTLSIARIRRLPRGFPVFVDSGAFREVNRRLEVVRPMSSEDWDRVLDAYRQVISADAKVFVVAPDRVGDQVVTLERMRRYAAELRELVAFPAWATALDEVPLNAAEVLVPVQGGELDLVAFYRAALEALAPGAQLCAQYIPAIPLNKSPISVDDVVAFVEAVRPERVHLLGIGPKRGRRFLEAIAAVSPSTQVTLDSNLLLSKIGRTNGRGNGPRDMTRARDWAAERTSDPFLVEAIGAETVAGLGRQAAELVAAIERAVDAATDVSRVQLPAFQRRLSQVAATHLERLGRDLEGVNVDAALAARIPAPVDVVEVTRGTWTGWTTVVLERGARGSVQGVPRRPRQGERGARRLATRGPRPGDRRARRDVDRPADRVRPRVVPLLRPQGRPMVETRRRPDTARAPLRRERPRGPEPRDPRRGAPPAPVSRGEEVSP